MWWSSNPASPATAPDEPLTLPDLINVADLLEQKRKEVTELREHLGDELKGLQHPLCIDDHFLLRYILSYRGDIRKAGTAVSEGLKWRKEHIDFVEKAMQSDVAVGEAKYPQHIAPYAPIINKFLAAWRHKSTKNNLPVVLVRMNCCSFYGLSQCVPNDILRDYVLFANEMEFWLCDRLTRSTGRLHKTYRLVDVKGLSARSIDRYFLKFFSASSKFSEFLHPQLVGKTVLVNSPSMVRIVIDMLRRFGVSRRALEKLWVCKAATPEAMLAELKVLIDEDNIPTFLGGVCSCPTGCIPGIDNTKCHPASINEQEINEEIQKRLSNAQNSDSSQTTSMDNNSEPNFVGSMQGTELNGDEADITNRIGCN